MVQFERRYQCGRCDFSIEKYDIEKMCEHLAFAHNVNVREMREIITAIRLLSSKVGMTMDDVNKMGEADFVEKRKQEWNSP